MLKPFYRQRGTALIEWTIVGPLGLLIIAAIIEMGFWMMAKSAVNYAIFEAARYGAVKHADLNSMNAAFKKALTPFYGGGLDSAEINKTYTSIALPDVSNSFSTLEIVNPTPLAFADFGVMENGQYQIPNDNLAHRKNDIGVKSLLSIQDANLLKIKVTYGYRLKMPFLRSIIVNLLKLVTADEQMLLMYAENRIPIVAQATVRMQSTIFEPIQWKTGYGFI